MINTDIDILNTIKNISLSLDSANNYVSGCCSNKEKILHIFDELLKIKIDRLPNVSDYIDSKWKDINEKITNGSGGFMQMVAFGGQELTIDGVNHIKYKYYKREYCDILLNLLNLYCEKLTGEEIYEILLNNLKNIVIKPNIKTFIINKINDGALNNQRYMVDILNEILKYDHEIVKYEIMECLINNINYDDFIDKYNILFYAHNEIKVGRKEINIPLELVKKFGNKLIMNYRIKYIINKHGKLYEYIEARDCYEYLDDIEFDKYDDAHIKVLKNIYEYDEDNMCYMYNKFASVFKNICKYDVCKMNTEFGFYMLNNFSDKCINKYFDATFAVMLGLLHGQHTIVEKLLNMYDIDIMKTVTEKDYHNYKPKFFMYYDVGFTIPMLSIRENFDMFNKILDKYGEKCMLEKKSEVGMTALYLLVQYARYDNSLHNQIINFINRYDKKCGIDGHDGTTSTFRSLVEFKYNESFLVEVINKFGDLILPDFRPINYNEHVLVHLMKYNNDEAACAFMDKFDNKIDYNKYYYLGPFPSLHSCMHYHNSPQMNMFTLETLAKKYKLTKSYDKIISRCNHNAMSEHNRVTHNEKN